MFAGLLTNIAVVILKKMIDKYLIPKLTEMAEASENKIDDVIVEKEVVENAKKIIYLGIDKAAERVKK